MIYVTCTGIVLLIYKRSPSQLSRMPPGKILLRGCITSRLIRFEDGICTASLGYRRPPLSYGDRVRWSILFLPQGTHPVSNPVNARANSVKLHAIERV